MRNCCFSSSYLIVNRISFSFGMLVRQNETFEYVTLAFGTLLYALFYITIENWGSCLSGSRKGRLSEPYPVYLQKCLWRRYWTPNCFAQKYNGAVWIDGAVSLLTSRSAPCMAASVWMCVWLGECIEVMYWAEVWVVGRLEKHFIRKCSRFKTTGI